MKQPESNSRLPGRRTQNLPRPMATPMSILTSIISLFAPFMAPCPSNMLSTGPSLHLMTNSLVVRLGWEGTFPLSRKRRVSTRLLKRRGRRILSGASSLQTFLRSTRQSPLPLYEPTKADKQSHLVNDGVQETPPSRSSDSQADEQPPLFVDLSNTNTSFSSWHPTPVTDRGNRLCGQGDMGGVWEWTSSALTQQEDFQPMELYPGYTADFFDGKHNVVLGGSWATHPRVAGRRSFVNWYQRKYPYAWVGARVVRNVE